jgi:hypothetical protein
MYEMYYAPMLRCWQLVMILVNTNHPCLHFHPGWPRPLGGFGHGGYYVGDGHYRNIGQQQDRMPPR